MQAKSVLACEFGAQNLLVQSGLDRADVHVLVARRLVDVIVCLRLSKERLKMRQRNQPSLEGDCQKPEW